MAAAKPVFDKATFQFFRELGKNNRKSWMDENRERYQTCVVQPFRRLLEELTPAVLRLNDGFDVSGRTGANFSRINRDIRFAKDKTPYKTQMYLKFQLPSPGDRESGQLYVGVSTDVVTVGFRIYSGGKRKESALALIAEPRIMANPKWVAQQKKRLGAKYESYWYTTEKGEWTKHEGWPTAPEDWKKILAWIVRKKMKPTAATRSAFPGEVAKLYRDVYPLLKFTSIP
ncbi:MAG TPA: DUF2461 family protein [Candidatus Limnocylindrales bacterium]|nr:DUF2461 family protein [Candidatus Limnocylindrales bacterium]